MADAMLQRFERSYTPEPNTGCWLWVRCWNSAGYGKICGFGDGSSMLAHRWSYERFRGPIPEGLVLDHLCRTPACVNPEHLEAVTMAENISRGDAPAILAACNEHNHNSRKTHCKNGHPLSGDNCRNAKRGRHHKRECRACDAQYQANRRRSKEHGR